MLNQQKVILENLKEEDRLECLSLNERVILRRILEKQGGKCFDLCGSG
jgi:hypothetical protein